MKKFTKTVNNRPTVTQVEAIWKKCIKARAKYQIIYADPPWEYGTWGKNSGNESSVKKMFKRRDVPIPYKTMSIKEIKELRVKDLADENCELYLWTTQKYLPVSFDVLKSWGFKYCQVLTWCKAPRGIGQGGVYCPTTEFLILGRIGKMPMVKRIDSTWWQVKRQLKHSMKPAFFRDLIAGVSNQPRLELFAREKTEGWDVWGNEIESDTNLETL